ncbi:MAG: nucleoside/nucleotide kinase family protein [Alphaproteobacteria bacterium]|nr:MAG: nucleoside/nucleotide kinase family protein [Alphaproteobacteria bacterium]
MPFVSRTPETPTDSPSPESLAEALVARVRSAPRRARRRLVALAGPPASGKSTLAGAMVHALGRAGEPAALVPMDGFHLDNRILEPAGLLARKGAPETFDLGGLARLVAALGTEDEVFYPLFDRARDIAIAGAGRVGPECATVVIEGNYLLFDAPGWRELARAWDLSVRLEVSEAELERRLVARWLGHGLDPDAARARARGNDLANAERIRRAALPADITLG